MSEKPAPESSRAELVVRDVLAHIDYARRTLHALVNSIPDNEITTPQIAAEQATEMDLRHAMADAATFLGAFGKFGGAV